MELLVASTIFAVLMVGLSAHLRGGMLAWRRTTTTADELQRVRVALERLTQDLANAAVVDLRPNATPQAVFAADTIQFYTVRPTFGPAVGGAGVPQAASLVWFVTYQLEVGAEERALLRSAQTIRMAKAALAAQAEPLLLNVKQLSIRYSYVSPQGALEWRNAWDDPAQLPKLVEVTIAFTSATTTPRAGQSSAAPRHLRRVVVIPSGTFKPAPGAS